MKAKKLGLSTILIILASAIIYLSYQKYVELKKDNFQAIQAVPNNAALIIKSENLNKSWAELNSSTLFQEISDNQKWQDLSTSILDIKNRVDSSESLQSFLFEQTVYLSIHPSKQDYFPLIAILSSKSNAAEFLLSSLEIINFTKRNYDEVSIYQLDEGWNICSHKGILFMSTSHLLVEQSIRQLNNNLSLLDVRSFVKVQKTESTFADAHIYINYQQLSSLLAENSELNSESEKQLSRWGDWAELDLKIKNNTLFFSGFTLSEDSSSNYLTTLRKQTPKSMNFGTVIPSNTNKIVAIALSDYKSYYQNYLEYLAKHNNLYEHNKWIQDENKRYDIDIENTFNAIIESEIATISTYSSSENSESYIIIKANQESEEILDFISQSIDTDSKTEEYRGFMLHDLKLENVIWRLLGPMFNSVNNNNFTWINGYLVFADSKTALKTFVNNYISKKVLDNKSTYKNFKNLLLEKCNFLYYTNPSSGTWINDLNKSWSSFIVEDKWKNINGFAYQISANNELFNNNVVLNYESNLKKESQLDWSVSLETIINTKPQITINHRTNKKEIVVQDVEKNLYQISTSGKILWQKKLGGTILGDVRQIDFYKNNRLQLLFNTKDSLYMIDRNGENVEDYPVELQEKAISGHKLLDYDNNKKYRILIPTENKTVDNYNKEGNIVKGWNFEAMPKNITQEIKYLKLKNKDYIYIIDEEGNTKLVGRNGKTRFNIGIIPLADSYHLNTKNGNILSTDANANVWQTDFKGNKLIMKSSELNKHFFIAHQVIGDDKAEFILSDSKQLSCYQGEAKAFSFEINNVIAPSIIEFNNMTYIGISAKENIYLLNNDGEIHPGTPVYGQGEFNCTDLDNDQKLNLIVGNENLLSNYSLE